MCIRDSLVTASGAAAATAATVAKRDEPAAPPADDLADLQISHVSAICYKPIAHIKLRPPLRPVQLPLPDESVWVLVATSNSCWPLANYFELTPYLRCRRHRAHHWKNATSPTKPDVQPRQSCTGHRHQHKKNGKVWTCGFWDVLADTQTQTNTQTSCSQYSAPLPEDNTVYFATLPEHGNDKKWSSGQCGE